MNAAIASLQSRLPQVGTTIFTVMSALAQAHEAVNLGQGFPDFPCDPALLDGVNAAMRAGHNQYPPMAGILPLREAVAEKVEALYGRRYDPAQPLPASPACCPAPRRRRDAVLLAPTFDHPGADHYYVARAWASVKDAARRVAWHP